MGGALTCACTTLGKQDLPFARAEGVGTHDVEIKAIAPQQLLAETAESPITNESRIVVGDSGHVTELKRGHSQVADMWCHQAQKSDLAENLHYIPQTFLSCGRSA